MPQLSSVLSRVCFLLGNAFRSFATPSTENWSSLAPCALEMLAPPARNDLR